ncbi:MAG: 3-oxoacyl-ACP reductase family protein [Bauldia sp.]
MTATLSGKTALVAGGSRGIGAAIVRRLAREGAAVAFTYANAEDKASALVAEVTAAGGRAIAIRADSADAEAVRAAVAATIAAFGKLDILVSNAGIMLRGEIDNYDLADFDRMLSVNVRGFFVAAQEAARHMTAGGRIVSIGSVVAERTGVAGASVYALTKAALAGFTRGLARDLGPRGITVNNVQPGPTMTDMNNDAVANYVRPLIALGRMAQDEEIASFVAYLAGPESSFITGASLTIDGGYLA